MHAGHIGLPSGRADMTAPLNDPRTPPYKRAGSVLLVVVVVAVALVWLQFRGELTPKTQLTMLSSRAGLATDPGSKVTYNGVQIGRVADVEEVGVDGVPKAKLTLDVAPEYIPFLPANVDADIRATTVFGNKYVSFTSPKRPSPQRITSSDIIDASNVTTEFNTVFETVMSLAEKVDPIKLNQTLTATAQALDGLGDRFGQSLVDGNEILADLNPRMPQIRYDTQRLADLADVYTSAAPDLFDGLHNAVTTAATLNEQQGNLDQALMAAVGFGNTGADIFEQGGPYLTRGVEDLLPSSALLNEYSPALFCAVRNFHNAERKVADAEGANGYSINVMAAITGAENPYVYPDNLPRVNAQGGPEGRPGCWQEIKRDLWPAPFLVMDTGASIAPYNHFELGQPLLTDYVWGRQVGEHTINP